MLQKIACPHCGVIGSAADSMVGMKLRCPRCEKVFLLMQDRLIGPSVSAIEIAGEESMSAVESGGVVSSAGGEKTFLEPITEMELEVAPEPEAEPEVEVVPEPEAEPEVEVAPEPEAEPEVEVVPEPEPEPEVEVAPEPEPEPEIEVAPAPEAEPEIEVVPAPEPEPEIEVAPAPEAEPEIEVAPEPEPEPEIEVVPAPEPEPEIEVAPAPEAEPEIEVAPEPEPELKIVHEAEPVLPVEETKGEDQEGEGLESTAMPAHVCDGCGESFHPEFMQEIDSKFYCGVCQLRSAALDAKEKAPRFGGGQLRGTLAALLLLGLLVLLVLVLKKLGII